MPKIIEYDDEDTIKAPLRRSSSRDVKATLRVMDIVLLLLLLFVIAALYMAISERLVKLEYKVEVISSQLSELKGDTNRSYTKLDESIRSLQNQIRETESFVLLNKQPPKQP